MRRSYPPTRRASPAGRLPSAETSAAVALVGGAQLVEDVREHGNFLGYARRAADETGLRHVTTCEVDGEEIGARWAGEFDAATSRLGLIYLPDRAKALRGIRSSLREGGRFAAVVHSGSELGDRPRVRASRRTRPPRA